MKKFKLFDKDYKCWPRNPACDETCPFCARRFENINQDEIYWASGVWFCDQSCYDLYYI